MTKLLMIDNYDSFTYNLVQYLGELGADVTVRRNDKIDIAGVRALAPDAIVVSPGPCTPKEAGISLAIFKELGRRSSDPRRMPRRAVHGRGVRRPRRSRPAPDAWQDLAGDS